MRTYQVATSGQPEEFTITNYYEPGTTAPETRGWMQYTPGVGFTVQMQCKEQNPKAAYTQPDDPVYLDSCMEVFLNCFPEDPDYGYINVEMNANGVMRCSFGTDRKHRSRLLEQGIPQPELTVIKEADFWQVRCIITEKLLETLYKRPCRFPSGHKMRGNFYKCGEKTEAPHWASWSELSRLDFHTPEFFGEITIE